MAEVRTHDRVAKIPGGGVQRLVLGPHVRLIAGTAAFLVTASVQAQSGACDQLKRTLAERLPGDPGRYSLEAVPSGTPLPPGGKFIGNCEGGAKKILYRRGVVAASAATPEGLPPGAEMPPSRLLAPGAASQPLDTHRKAAAAVIPPDENSAIAPMLRDEPAEPPSQTISWWAWAAGLAVGHWTWLLAAMSMPLVWSAWAWWSHRRLYDAAGLPRGPRLSYQASKTRQPR